MPVCGANYKSKNHIKVLEELARPATVKPAVTATQLPVMPEAKKAAAITMPAVVPPTRPSVATATVSPSLPTTATNSLRAENTMKPANLETLRLSRETLSALQQLQQQTADLHRRFLEGQEQAQKTILALISGSIGTAPDTSAFIQPTQPRPAATYANIPAVQTAPARMPAAIQAPVQTPAMAAPVSAPIMPAQPAKAVEAPAIVKPAESNGRIRGVLLDVVSEKTGYPVEMLNPEMDMEADLGIDSIKRVEIMSAVQERLTGTAAVRPGQMGKLGAL